MGLLGDSFDDPRTMATLAAAGALMSGRSLGQGLLGGVQAYSGLLGEQQDRTTKKALTEAQMENYRSEAETRKAQLAQSARQQAYWFGDGTASQPSATASQLGVTASQLAVNGAPGSPAPSGGGKLDDIARQYGIPKDALAADLMNNGGKKIAELIADSAKPNWQNVNGNLVNTNARGFQGGLQAGVSAGSNGQVTAWQPDGQGGLVVGAPRGAIDTFNAYQGVQAGFKPLKVYNPATQREEYSSEAAVTAPARGVGPMAGPAGNVQSSGYAGGDRNAANADSIAIMQAELRKLEPNHPDRPVIQREIQRMQMQGAAPQSGNFAAGPSAAEQAASKAQETRAVDTAKAEVVRDTAEIKKGKSAVDMVSAVQEARTLLKQGPTGSGLGELYDKGANFLGQSPKGADVAAKLDIVAGTLLNNVPRMEGPQSDGDRKEYQIQAGRMADRSVPVSQRLAAADQLEKLQRKYAGINGGGGGASGDYAGDQSPAMESNGKKSAMSGGGWSAKRIN